MTGQPPLNDEGLLALLALAKRRDYHFITPTPNTHARVVARPWRRLANSMTDVLGWNLPFDADMLDRELVEHLRTAGALEASGEQVRSRVRISTLHGEHYLHSSYPTEAQDAVFFGPDSYRFADLIHAELNARPLKKGASVADIGTGAGVGIIVAAKTSDGGCLFATDVNAKALRLARINALAAGISAQFIHRPSVKDVPRPIDLITINPPYLIDAGERAYRHGGGMHGGEVTLSLARAAIAALAPGGRLILYTGSAIVDTIDQLRLPLIELATTQACSVVYREIDPDVFGEELDRPQYADADRIAAIAAVFTRS